MLKRLVRTLHASHVDLVVKCPISPSIAQLIIFFLWSDTRVHLFELVASVCNWRHKHVLGHIGHLAHSVLRENNHADKRAPSVLAHSAKAAWPLSLLLLVVQMASSILVTSSALIRITFSGESLQTRTPVDCFRIPGNCSSGGAFLIAGCYTAPTSFCGGILAGTSTFFCRICGGTLLSRRPPSESTLPLVSSSAISYPIKANLFSSSICDALRRCDLLAFVKVEVVKHASEWSQNCFVGLGRCRWKLCCRRFYLFCGTMKASVKK